MTRFPSWWQISEEFPPKLFHTADEVPPGWTRCKGFYNAETGQWEEGDPLDHDDNGRKGGSDEKVAPTDLPAIAGFVRDGFDMDAPEAGYPARTPAVAEPADKVVPDEGKPGKRNRRGRKALKGKGKSAREGSTQMSDQPKPEEKPKEGDLTTPQPNESPSKPQDPNNVVRERSSDGTVRTGNRPTVR